MIGGIYWGMKTYRVQVIDGVTGEQESVYVEAVSAADARGVAAARTGKMAGAVTEVPPMAKVDAGPANGADEDVMRKELERLKQVERFEKAAADLVVVRMLLERITEKMGKADVLRAPVGTIATAVLIGMILAGVISAVVGGFLMYKGMGH